MIVSTRRWTFPALLAALALTGTAARAEDTPGTEQAPAAPAPADPAPAPGAAAKEAPPPEAPPAAKSAAPAAAAAGAACAECHEEVAGAFGHTIHAKTHLFGKAASCETCHEGGPAHAQSGDRKLVTNPAKVDAAKSSAICLGCHGRERRLAWWRGSSHELNQIGCSGCHSVHQGGAKLLARSPQNSLCFGCHLGVRSEVLKRSKHPLRDSAFPAGDGRMACSDCHNPHGGRSTFLIDAPTVNEQCYRCHFEKKAPVLWEHSPVKEDCLVCHKAHGSSNDKLLVSRVPRLCQECHMQGRHQSGTLAPNSVFAINRSCLNCHAQIHGSNSPSGAVLQR